MQPCRCSSIGGRSQRQNSGCFRTKEYVALHAFCHLIVQDVTMLFYQSLNINVLSGKVKFHFILSSTWFSISNRQNVGSNKEAESLWMSCCSGTNVLRKLHPHITWYLISVGSLATTQMECVALHAFHCRNVQMQNAILQSCLDHFPKYEEQPPVMPDCFTPNFADHLHRTFNGPHLSAIHLSAMYLAAETSLEG